MDIWFYFFLEWAVAGSPFFMCIQKRNSCPSTGFAWAQMNIHTDKLCLIDACRGIVFGAELC